MKWLGLLIAIASIAPLSVWLRSNPRLVPKIWMLIGFLPFVLESAHLYMGAISWAGWPGYVRGVEFSALDALAIALYFSLPNAPYRPLPFRLSMALYLLAVFLSSIQATMPEAALFYPWQLARMFLIYAVVTRASVTDPRPVLAILKGMAAGLIMEAAIVIWQRFGSGVLQATGNFDHQNILGMMSQFVTFPFFAMMLAGRGGLFNPVVILAGVVVAILTVSRGTIGVAVIGYSAVFLLSAAQRLTYRKVLVLLASAAAIAVLLPVVFSSLEQRGDWVQQSDSARVALSAEAAQILSDHPWGIGSNQYVNAARQGGYREPGTEWGALVHNVYLLVAAETGYFGLVAFVIFLFCPMAVAFRCAWRNRGDMRADLLFGLGVAMLTVYVQSYFEWVFLQQLPQYMFAMILGMVAGLAQQLGYWTHSTRKALALKSGLYQLRQR